MSLSHSIHHANRLSFITENFVTGPHYGHGRVTHHGVPKPLGESVAKVALDKAPMGVTL